MDELLLSIGFFLQVLSVIWIIFLIRDRRAKKRIDSFWKQDMEDVEIGELEVERDDTTLQNYYIPLRERYGGILEEKEDFIPKKKMKYHTLDEPIEYYSENEAGDEGCGCDTVCNNCYDTTIYDL